MTASYHTSDVPNRLRVTFADAQLVFDVPKYLTLGALAEEVAQLGHRYGDSPLYVDIRIGNWSRGLVEG